MEERFPWVVAAWPPCLVLPRGIRATVLFGGMIEVYSAQTGLLQVGSLPPSRHPLGDRHDDSRVVCFHSLAQVLLASPHPTSRPAKGQGFVNFATEMEWARAMKFFCKTFHRRWI